MNDQIIFECCPCPSISAPEPGCHCVCHAPVPSDEDAPVNEENDFWLEINMICVCNCQFIEHPEDGCNCDCHRVYFEKYQKDEIKFSYDEVEELVEAYFRLQGEYVKPCYDARSLQARYTASQKMERLAYRYDLAEDHEKAKHARRLSAELVKVNGVKDVQ